MKDIKSFKIMELKERNFQKRFAQALGISLDNILEKEKIRNLNKFRNEILQNHHNFAYEYFDVYDFNVDEYFSESQQVNIYNQAFERLIIYFRKLFCFENNVFILFYWEGERVGISISGTVFLMKIEFFKNITNGITIISNDFNKIIEIYRMEYKLELIFSNP